VRSTASTSPEDLLQKREKRINDAIALREPDQVPVMFIFGFFPARVGGITFEEAMYDYDKTMQSWIKAMVEFQPDAYDDPFTSRFFGRILERLDYKQFRWPGHGVRWDLSFQYVEDEYMKGNEYDAFLSDPSDFMLRKYWPRIFGSLQAFENLFSVPGLYSYSGFGKLATLDTPDMAKALEDLMAAAKEAKRMLSGSAAYGEKMKELGFPPQFGSMAHAPFDVISDFLRGTVGAMLDMYRKPDELLEAVEKIYPAMLQNGLGAKKNGIPRVFIPLHKGIDSFMSPEQFKTFYWPTLRRLILAFIDEGLNPFVFWEGDCTSRLELIGDIPRGKAVYMFESTNVFKAKEILGDVVCIRGNVPLSILLAGTPSDVRDYCKKLIDVVGKGGGFIMDASTNLDDAKPENLKAMIEFTKEYGRYI
jgi:uroporphyrinogen-III decarboxylase